MSVGELIATVREAFSKEMRPKRFTVAETQFPGWSDVETRRAETVFASRDPETLQATDLGIGAGWPEIYLSEPGLHYYMPGFVRLVLEDNGFSLDDFLRILSPDRIRNMSQKRKAAITLVLKFVRDQVDERWQELIDRRLKRLRA